jgi:hypothetical protein
MKMALNITMEELTTGLAAQSPETTPDDVLKALGFQITDKNRGTASWGVVEECADFLVEKTAEGKSRGAGRKPKRRAELIAFIEKHGLQNEKPKIIEDTFETMGRNSEGKDLGKTIRRALEEIKKIYFTSPAMTAS